MLISSRLVARDFKNKNDERNFDAFAATPPLEMKRLLFRMARVKGSVGGNDKDGQVKLMYNGIHEQGDRREGRGLGRRLHVPREDDGA